MNVRDLSYNNFTGEIPFNIGFLQVATLYESSFSHSMNYHSTFSHEPKCDDAVCSGVYLGPCKVTGSQAKSRQLSAWCKHLQCCEYFFYFNCFVISYLDLVLWYLCPKKKIFIFALALTPSPRDLSCNMLSGTIPPILGNLTYNEKM